MTGTLTCDLCGKEEEMTNLNIHRGREPESKRDYDHCVEILESMYLLYGKGEYVEDLCHSCCVLAYLHKRCGNTSRWADGCPTIVFHAHNMCGGCNGTNVYYRFPNLSRP